MFWMPSMWTVGSVQGSLPELDHGLGVATVTVDGVEKACCSFDSQEFGKALSGPHITHSCLLMLSLCKRRMHWLRNCSWCKEG